MAAVGGPSYTEQVFQLVKLKFAEFPDKAPPEEIESNAETATSVTSSEFEQDNELSKADNFSHNKLIEAAAVVV